MRTMRGESCQVNGRGPSSIGLQLGQLLGVLHLGGRRSTSPLLAGWRLGVGQRFLAMMLLRECHSRFFSSSISFLMLPDSIGMPRSLKRCGTTR